jgi:hypothetical protein
MTDFAIANNFTGVYNIYVDPARDVNKTRFCNLLAEVIVNIINNGLISTVFIRDIINLINNNVPLHRSLIPLLEDYQRTEDKVSMIYCIINNYLCNERFRGPINRSQPNLIFTINVSVIYLIAGLINNKGGNENLILSISQCMRKSLYPSIFNDGLNRFGFLNGIADNIKPGSIVCALIYLLFSKNYTDLVNEISIPMTEAQIYNYIDNITTNNAIPDYNLNFIMKYAYNVMNNIIGKSIFCP